MGPLRERARRLRVVRDAPHPFRALEAGLTPDQVAEQQGLPIAHVRGVATFYDAFHDLAHRRCTGTACWLSDGAHVPAPREGVHCLGHCYAPHGKSIDIPASSLLTHPVVLRHALASTTHDPFADYRQLPTGEVILDAVERSGLRGRGGAAYPTGAKWRVARNTPARERIVVANGDEGDPGAYIDRLLMEQTPHALLAGMLACARAIGARTGIVFVRGEYPRAVHTLEAAIAQAREHELLDDLDVRVIRGAGSYVAGEESALLQAIEGLRAEPQPKPPFPAQRGLWGLPTVVQNVETLSVIPWVVTHVTKPESKAFCLSGAVRRTGVVEAKLGVTLEALLEQGGGGNPGTRPWKMALVGGPMGRVLPASRFDAKLDYDGLPGLGHAGVVVMDDQVSAKALFSHLVAFAQSESCGNCTPCRAGTSQLARAPTRAALERLLTTLEIGSLCGFGQGVPRPIRDLLEHFSEELFS